jgi:hypothetical protein
MFNAFSDDVSLNRISGGQLIKDSNSITTVSSNEVQPNGVCAYGGGSGYAGGRGLKPDSILTVFNDFIFLD